MRLFTLFATLGLAILMTVSLPAQTVRVIFTSGQASMQRPDETVPHPVVKGETLVIGTRIITGPDGRVVITPMPGVKSIIAPNTTLVLESASEARTSVSEVTHSAVLDLKEGAVVSDLNKPEGVSYNYSIRTIRGLAGARGTTFSVGINPAGIQTIVVSHGTISLNFADGRVATLTIGQLSVTGASGETRNVSGIAELPPEDQAAAQAFTETMLVTLSEAVANGVSLAPDALANALAAAESLGVPISPEVKAAAESAIKSSTTTPPTTGTSSTTTTSEIVTETVPTVDPYAAYRATLTTSQLAAFNVLPADIQSQLATLNDSSITAIALSPSEETGLAHTYQDLRIHLAAFLRLSAEQVTFLKGLSYSQTSDPLANSPDPAAWSLEAINRALATWNGLTSGEQTMIVGMGAGEILVDRSASYISGLLASLDNTQQVLVTDMGWGHDLETLAGKPTSTFYFTAAAALGGAERYAAKYFEIDAGSFHNPNATSALQALATFDTAQQETLRQLGVGHFILNGNGSTTVNSSQFIARLNNALSFYASLTAAQQEASRALDLGYLLYTYAPSDTLGGGGTTALQQVTALAQFYIDNPGLRQAMRDSELLNDTYAQENPSIFNSSQAIATLDTYLALPERTRTYLAVQDEFYNFFNLANPGANSPYRTLAQINALLSGLTADEFGALLDMNLARAVIENGDADTRVTGGYLGSDPLATLKATLAAFTALPDNQKFVLRELGILGEGNIAVIGADSAGLSRLLSAYAALPGSLRAATERLDAYSAGGIATVQTYGNLANPSVPVDRSYFFPDGFDQNHVIQKIAFQSTGDLHVGATRYLRINNSAIGVETFVTGSERDLYLRASDLIDLNSTLFSANIRAITMSAATVNLTNIDFPEGSVASLNSSSGQIAFWSAVDTVPLNNGKVNFKTVSYGGNALTSLSDLTSPSGANGNIAIGSLASPAALPTYTPTAP